MNTAEEGGKSLAVCLTAVGRRQDAQAFATLFDYFAPRVKNYLRRLGAGEETAEEITQEVMIAVWRKAAQYDPARATPSTWIFAIARNLRIDRLRRLRHPEPQEDDPALVPDPAPPPDIRLGQAQQRRRLQEALRTLPEEQVKVLSLSFFHDKPHPAIAAELGIPLGTVKSRLRLAMKRIRALMGESA